MINCTLLQPGDVVVKYGSYYIIDMRSDSTPLLVTWMTHTSTIMEALHTGTLHSDRAQLAKLDIYE